MTTLRSLLFLLSFALIVIGYGSYLVVFGKRIGRQGVLAVARSWSFVSLRALKLLCGLDYRLTGLDNLPARSCILMCKHQSTWETIAVPGIVPCDQAWVLKQELMQVPFFGWALHVFQPIAIDRKAGRRAMLQLLQLGQRHLDAGECVLVFPEGTRVAVGEVAAFNIGGALLAEKSGAPVVPIAHNAGVFWKRRGLRKFAGQIDIVIGPPIESRGRSAKEINRLAEAWINETVRALPQRP